MPKKKTINAAEARALIIKEAMYRLGCEDFTPVFTLRRAEHDAPGCYPRANWDADAIGGAESWPPECAEAFREAVTRIRGKYNIDWRL